MPVLSCRRQSIGDRFRNGLLAAAFSLLFVPVSVIATPLAARADVKVVQETTASGLEEILEKGNTTDVTILTLSIITYYKGDKFRQDFSSRNVYYLYDCAKDRFIMVDKVNQVYSIRTLAEAMKSLSSSRIKVEGSATVEEGGSTRIIAGKGAKNYNMDILLVLKDARRGVPLASIKMQGDHWSTSALKMPAACASMKKIGFFPTIQSMHNLLGPVYEKTAKMNGVPLDYNLVFTIVAGGTQGAQSESFELRSEVKSISSKALPASLFTVPKGFRLVDEVVDRIRDDS